jgi:hypothetical protein
MGTCVQVEEQAERRFRSYARTRRLALEHICVRLGGSGERSSAQRKHRRVSCPARATADGNFRHACLRLTNCAAVIPRAAPVVIACQRSSEERALAVAQDRFLTFSVRSPSSVEVAALQASLVSFLARFASS